MARDEHSDLDTYDRNSAPIWSTENMTWSFLLKDKRIEHVSYDLDFCLGLVAHLDAHVLSNRSIGTLMQVSSSAAGFRFISGDDIRYHFHKSHEVISTKVRLTLSANS